MSEQRGKADGNRIVRPKNVSLYPAHRAALEALARRDGHENEARVVQELIASRASEVWGEHWADVVTNTDLKAA